MACVDYFNDTFMALISIFIAAAGLLISWKELIQICNDTRVNDDRQMTEHFWVNNLSKKHFSFVVIAAL